MSARLLCVGDVHLGRRPARLPDDLEEPGVSARELGPAAAWRRAVAAALEHRVAAVLLAGDVVESDNRWFEAFGPLEDGVRRLVDAGIDVLAVAGNHDVEALPRLADRLPGFHLLGRGGRWEEREVRAEGRVVARVLGWSFPQARVTESPLARLPATLLERGDGVPRFGLLHGDLDQRSSVYAPLARPALERVSVRAWLLGHVHRPDLDPAASTPIGYLGSLQGLTLGELGRRGPWLVELDGAGGARFEHLPLAPLRWEVVEVDVTGLSAAADLRERVVAALRSAHARLAPELSETRAVGCRLVLVGETSIERELAAELAREDPTRLRRAQDGVAWFVADCEARFERAVDLVALARWDDPPGWLARRLLALERGDDDGSFLEEARGRLARVAERSQWADLPRRDLDDGAARALLVRAGRRALAELLRQRPGTGEGAA